MILQLRNRKAKLWQGELVGRIWMNFVKTIMTTELLYYNSISYEF